ncbi:MAG: prolyl oligopeptidase family serine peptidase [Meiothermus sp.]|uniref:alpha/beta hydrolase family protein n=1 Tax=Meiothermus sp. TaxID=1955249 RepID=UPI00298ED2AC|nr:prolyl oligopeptidase family serine peptidase [Meiothermus sp.]MDW8424714.1 prolyl oligopeptidase family serine peptidase [Meiothermus sp.]
MRRWIGLWALAWGLAGCTEPSPVGLGGWESVQTLYRDAFLLREKVAYRSGGLKVFGQVCRPNRQGQFPIVLWNHGGFEGLQVEDENLCQNLALLGYVVLMSSYRGEDGSEGAIEVCQGEVDDVLEMLAIGRTMPYANPSRVAVAGGSHGGCIALWAVQKGAPAQVLIDIFGPTDWATEYRQLEQLAASSDPLKKQLAQQLGDIIRSRLGGTPAQVPGRYRERSPVADAASLRNWPGSVLVVHGALDWVVPPEQSCNLAQAVGGFTHFRITRTGATSSTAPAGCAGAGLSWSGGEVPRGQWAGRRYLLVYDEFGHGDGEQAGLAVLDALNYLGSKFPAN